MRTHRSLFLFALLLALPACGDEGPTEPIRTGYDLTVSGDLAVRVRGEAFFGADTDESGAPIFAVLLGQDTSSHTILLGKRGAATPARGSYGVGEDEDDWGAIYILSEGEELLGILVADSGRISITQSSATRLSGTVDLYASGLLDDEDGLARVRVTGTFSARPAPAPAALARAPLPF